MFFVNFIADLVFTRHYKEDFKALIETKSYILSSLYSSNFCMLHNLQHKSLIIIIIKSVKRKFCPMWSQETFAFSFFCKLLFPLFLVFLHFFPDLPIVFNVFLNFFFCPFFLFILNSTGARHGSIDQNYLLDAFFKFQANRVLLFGGVLVLSFIIYYWIWVNPNIEKSSKLVKELFE